MTARAAETYRANGAPRKKLPTISVAQHLRNERHNRDEAKRLLGVKATEVIPLKVLQLAMQVVKTSPAPGFGVHRKLMFRPKRAKGRYVWP